MSSVKGSRLHVWVPLDRNSRRPSRGSGDCVTKWCQNTLFFTLWRHVMDAKDLEYISIDVMMVYV